MSDAPAEWTPPPATDPDSSDPIRGPLRIASSTAVPDGSRNRETYNIWWAFDGTTVLRCGVQEGFAFPGWCHREIGPGETAWRRHLRWRVWVCDDCHAEHIAELAAARAERAAPDWLPPLRTWMEPVPCEGDCGRQLAYIDRDSRNRYATCTERCLAAARRQRDRPPPAPCAVCREPVTASRSDARYCSPAHRQKAYRQRRKDTTP